MSVFHDARDLNRALHTYEDVSQVINIYFSSQTERNYSTIFSTLHISVYFTEIHSHGSVTVPKHNTPVSVTLIGLVDIYLLLDKIN